MEVFTYFFACCGAGTLAVGVMKLVDRLGI